MSARAGLIATVVSLLLAAFPSAARSCSCVEFLHEPAEQLSKSGLVFTGTVISVSVVTLPYQFYTDEEGEFVPHQGMERRALVTLRTTREWKGDGAETYTVLAGAPPDPPLPDGLIIYDCDEHLDLGKEYLVFTTEGGFAEANSCALGGLVDERREEIEALDAYVTKDRETPR